MGPFHTGLFVAHPVILAADRINRDFLCSRPSICANGRFCAKPPGGESGQTWYRSSGAYMFMYKGNLEPA